MQAEIRIAGWCSVCKADPDLIMRLQYGFDLSGRTPRRRQCSGLNFKNRSQFEQLDDRRDTLGFQIFERAFLFAPGLERKNPRPFTRLNETVCT